MKHLSIVLALLVFITFGLISCRRDVIEPPIVPVGEPWVARGRNLVHGLAACGYCHGADSKPGAALSGGRVMVDSYGEVRVANITPADSGIGSWRTDEVMRAIRVSVDPAGDWLSEEGHAGYAWLSDNDLFGVIAYLRTVTPVENVVPRRKLSFLTRNTSGLFDSRSKIPGHVPAVRKSHVLAYGRYLVDHVARCGVCHSASDDPYEPEGYLEGGSPKIHFKNSKSVAPSLSFTSSGNNSAWSEEEIVAYLRTGKTPAGRVIDPSDCPTNFYARAESADLAAIARFLKLRPHSG